MRTFLLSPFPLLDKITEDFFSHGFMTLISSCPTFEDTGTFKYREVALRYV